MAWKPDTEVWERRDRARGPVPLFEDYVRVGSTALPSAVPARGVSRWIVHVPPDGPRWTRRAGASPDSARPSDAAGTAAATFVLVSEDGLAGGRAWVVDAEGRPFGAVGAGLCRLPIPFEGFVLAAGATPVPVRVAGARPLVRVELRPRSWVGGRVQGSFDPGDLVAYVAPGPGVVGANDVVAADGRFELGPLPPGERLLAVASRHRRRPETLVPVRVHAGRQDLGVIRLEEYASITIQLPRAAGTQGAVFATPYREDWREAVRASFCRRVDAPVRRILPRRPGELVIDRVPHGVWAGWLWTRRGDFGSFRRARCPGQGRPVAARWRPPGTIAVRIAQVSGAILEGGRILCYDARYTQPAREVLRYARMSPAVRARSVATRSRLRVTIDGVWPIEIRVVLLGEDGHVIAAARVPVRSGSAVPVVLRPPAGRGTLVLSGAGLRRPRRLSLLRRGSGTRIRCSLAAGKTRQLTLLEPGQWEILPLDVAAKDRAQRWVVEVVAGRETTWICPPRR